MKSSTIEAMESGLGQPLEGADSCCEIAPEEKREYWAFVLHRQRASGLTISAFCRQERVSMDRFFYWKRRLASNGSTPAGSGGGAGALVFSEFRMGPSAGARLVGSPPGRRSGGGSRELRIVWPPDFQVGPASGARLAGPTPGVGCGGVEMITPGGWVIRVEAGVDAAWAARLVRALAGNKILAPTDAGKGGRPC